MAGEGAAGGKRPGRRSGVVIPHQLPWHKRLLARLAYGLIRLLSATLRFRYHDLAHYFPDNPIQPVVVCIWHNRLALSLMAYKNGPQRIQPARRMAAIVSASRDGAVVARILELFGVQPVRGSTSRRGPQALLELTTWAERGYDLAVTPDGPRGPRYCIQEGVVAMAQLTGLPIVPACYHLNWKIQAKSWDRFQIPLPFARVTVSMGEPIRVRREAGDAEREEARKLLEERMRAITRD
jgi:lysophospholipid acyltransferase (LPLAT)-like uncharacterized protein